jgi:hypothetical protein
LKLHRGKPSFEVGAFRKNGFVVLKSGFGFVWPRCLRGGDDALPGG